MNKKDVLQSLLSAFTLTLIAHIQNARAYAKAFLLEKPSYIPREPLMLVGYFVVIFLIYVLVRTYKEKALAGVLIALAVVVFAVRLESRSYLQWLGYQEISVGLPAKECSTLYDLGTTFEAIDPYTNLPVKGFVCWDDFTTWQASYYTN